MQGVDECDCPNSWFNKVMSCGGRLRLQVVSGCALMCAENTGSSFNVCSSLVIFQLQS